MLWSDSEAGVRLAVFLTVVAVMLAWEALAPRRPRTVPRRLRWPGNLGITLIDTLTVRLVFPAAAVGAALTAQQRGWGLLPLLGLPPVLSAAAAIVLLDLSVYLQHVAFHHVPWLWRLHRVHHADLDLDVTSGARFHPVESVASMAAKIATVIALGASPITVLVFEVLLNACAMFNHSNINLPPGIDRVLRLLVVTPDMHRVHHSVRPEETNSNYGFNLPWWDRVFRTYRSAPADGQMGMTIGLTAFRDPRELRLHRLLVQPFRR